MDLSLLHADGNWGWGMDGNVLIGQRGFVAEFGGGVAAIGGEYRAILSGALFLSLSEMLELGYRYQQPILTGPRPEWLPPHYVAIRMNLPIMFQDDGEPAVWIFGSD